ncbi:MAG: hypothetical protein HY366_00520 [Candidatus Aenigmarchaeota archaeon]|nr:hypothetical protein [Candidatus Aenigmarchaeota archaeon]
MRYASDPVPFIEPYRGCYISHIAGFSDLLKPESIGVNPQALYGTRMFPGQAVTLRLDPPRRNPTPLYAQKAFKIVALLPPKQEEARPNYADGLLRAHVLSFYGVVLSSTNDAFERIHPGDDVALNTMGEEGKLLLQRVVKEHLSSYSS